MIAQLSDRVLKTAKKKLDELGVIKHVSSPFGTITEQAIKGIQSWKTKTVSFHSTILYISLLYTRRLTRHTRDGESQGDDKEDDEQAASQFLQHH